MEIFILEIYLYILQIQKIITLFIGNFYFNIYITIENKL